MRLSSGLGALAMVALAQPAFAADECGVAPVSGTVTCPAGVYAAGVTYVAAAPLTVVLNADSAITPIAGTSGVTVTGNQAQTLNAAAGSTITTNGAPAVSLATTTAPIIATTGTIRTTGTGAQGILTSSTGGNTTITARDTATTGAGSTAIQAATTTGTLTVNTGTVNTTGALTTGVSATSTGGRVIVNGGTVTTTGTGVLASTTGTETASVIGGTITTSGTGARGVNVSTATGAATATPVSVTTSGANADAITVTSTGGAATAGATTVRATGSGSRGIVVTGGTTATVNAANVTADSDAVRVTAGTGAATATLSGTNTSANGSGAVLSGNTAGLTLTSGSLIGGTGGNGATLTSANGATVTNSGTISGPNAAIQVLGAGSANITNTASGVINGRILLGAGNDNFANAGTFNATGVSDFGAGTDVLSNTGTINVRPGLTTAGDVTLANLEAFNNSGTINLSNGVAGDTLAISGNFTGSGASSLVVDATAGTTTTDRLTIAGAATGSTAVTVNTVGTGPAVLTNATGTAIVTAGPGSTSNAFVIAAGSQNTGGIIQNGVIFVPGATPGTGTFNLVTAPGAAAYRTSLFGDGVRNLWLQSGDAWSAHMRELRDNIAANGPGGAGGRFWFQGYGQNERRNNGSTYTFNGITTAVDLGYDQDYYGFQMGMDLGAPVGDEGGFNFGITGGYQNSTMSFRNTADAIKFNSVNGGVYASFTSGIFFLNALGKYDYYWGENVSPAGNYRSDVNGSVWGAKAEAGMRFGQDFFIEPAASISWTNSDFDDLGVPSGNFAIDDDNGLRGKVGARVGYVTQAGGAKLTIYGGANYVHEFRGRDDVVFTSGGQSVAFRSPYNNDYVEGTLGVNIGSDAGRVSGFFEGRYGEGNDYRGYGARGGMRVRF